MSNIQQNLAKILSSRYGRDVRQAIHDSIQTCYTESKFVPRGAYSSTATYSFPDMVTSGGGSYLYINPTPAAGVPVTDTSHWQQIASVGGQDILNAVTAEKNAAIAAKVLAEGYAAQLAAGIASPAGTYADLAALNDGTPTAPDVTKIYITLDDGQWCYYNGSAWVAGGVYLATDAGILVEALTEADESWVI